MLTTERWQHILDRLARESAVQVTELVDELGVSESTIRRDLTELEQQNRLVRVHGGAHAVGKKAIEPLFHDKLTELVSEKEAIAKVASQYVSAGDTIYVDAGTTTLRMGPHLASIPKLTIVTNGLKQAEEFSALGSEVILIGGLIKAGTQAVIGSMAYEQLQRCHFDKAFMGMNGICIRAGLTTPDIHEATVKQKAMQQSQAVFVLADHRKFDQVTFAKVSNLDQAHIITDRLGRSDLNRFRDYTNIEEVFRT